MNQGQVGDWNMGAFERRAYYTKPGQSWIYLTDGGKGGPQIKKAAREYMERYGDVLLSQKVLHRTKDGVGIYQYIATKLSDTAAVRIHALADLPLRAA